MLRRDGEVDGFWEKYSEEGTIVSRTKYKNGKMNGPSETFYESGTLQTKTIYKHGTEVGPRTIVDRMGVKKSHNIKT